MLVKTQDFFFFFFFFFLLIINIRTCVFLILAGASKSPGSHKKRRPAVSTRGTVEVLEEEVGDAINNNSNRNPVPNRCLWIEAR